MAITLDFEKSYTNNLDQQKVLDLNMNIYRPNDRTDGLVYVEKVFCKKDRFKTTPLGTRKSDRNAFLIKETNQTDVNGGFMTFEKHYATIPSTWYEYELMTYRELWDGRVNYRNNFNGSGSSWDKTRKSIARAERRYFFENQNSFGIPVLPTDFVPDGDDNAGTNFVDDFTKIYTVSPESQRSGTAIERVIAPDKIQLYLGNIYELTRYTIIL